MSDMTKALLKAKIDTHVTTNGANENTDARVNEVMQDMIDTLADGANMDAGSIDTAQLKLKDGAITTQKIDTGAVTASELAANAVETAKIKDKNVTKGKLADAVNENIDWAVATQGIYQCTDSGSATAKAVTAAGWDLRGGGTIIVRFVNKNTANNPTLNINGTGAKAMMLNNKSVSATNTWEDGQIIEFMYYPLGQVYYGRLVSEVLPAYININELCNHPAAYASEAAALAAVPTMYRRKGVKVVYYDDDSQYWIELACQDDAGGANWWTDVENNWVVEGPIQTKLASASGGQCLWIAGERRGNLDDFLNVNVWNAQNTEYADADESRAAVPATKRKLGAVITYLVSKGVSSSEWVTERFIGSATSGWTIASNWEKISDNLKWATTAQGMFKCTTAGATAAKEVAADGWDLRGGGSIKIRFANANTAASPTLNINGTGAKAMMLGSSSVSATNTWGDNAVIEFTYYPLGNVYLGHFVSLDKVSVSQNTLIIGGVDKGKVPTDIIDNLISVDVASALSANQGRVLKGLIDTQDQEISDFEDAVQDQIDNYPMITINGNVTNAPDEEDITIVTENGNNVLKFKNRAAVDGMGYKILRKGTGLTFANQVTDQNTIYEIRYDFNLTADFTVPPNCVLKFNGGSISGAFTLTGQNTRIDAELVQIFGSTLTLAGTWDITQSFPEWFGADGDGVTDDYLSVQKSLDFGSSYLSSVYNLNGNKLTPRSDGKTIFAFAEDGALKNGEIDADISFSIVSGNNFIFQDIDFVGTPDGSSGTTLQLVRHDVNAEWFGIYREGIEHNAERLERLLNCYNVSVKFDSFAYYFNRPIESKAFRIEMHGTSQRGTSRSKLILVQNVFYDTYAETNVFLKLNTYETVIDGISFQAILDNDMTYFNGLELVDNVNKGQIDTYITNCGFEGFDRAIIAHGRGIDVENCWFNRCNFGLRYIPAVEQAHTDPNQNPPYDGRAIRFVNNRLHWMYVYVGHGQVHGSVAIYLEALQNEIRYVHGIQVLNNLCDVYCGLLYSLVGIIKGNIVGNSCNNWKQYQMFFKEDVIDTIIANNNLSYRIPADISADYSASDSRCNNCIYFEGNINGLIITGNTGKVFKQNFVRFNNNSASINNVVISGNIISNEDDYRGVLGLDSAYVTHLRFINNTINISTGKKIWDAFLPYSDNTIFEDVEVDAFTATRFTGKYKVNLIGYPHVGDNSHRPTIPNFINDTYKQNSLKGFEYFDLGLGKPIYATVINNGSIVWVDATGVTV